MWESERRIAVLGIGGDYSRRALGMVVRRPLRRLWRPFWLRFTYVTSVLVKRY
eukprot:SAG25_NODE_191_length_12265_cov_16.310538_3_plen_53_part_00